MSPFRNARWILRVASLLSIISAFSIDGRRRTTPFVKMDTEAFFPHNFVIPFSPSSAPQIMLQLPTSSLEHHREQCPTDSTWKHFWDYQLNQMEFFANLERLPTTNKDGTQDFAYTEENGVICQNLALSSEHFSKIRLTLYHDKKRGTSVFNSLFYPRGDLPLLGIDLLQFQHGKRHLCVMDLQPLESQAGHQDQESLAEIQARFPVLQGKMTNRFYDATQFFSDHTLFGRFEDDTSLLEEQIYPAFQQILQLYMEQAEHLGTKQSQEEREAIVRGQAAYDVYSAARDPAIHMMKKVFGEQWADQYVHEFLFDRSR